MSLASPHPRPTWALRECSGTNRIGLSGIHPQYRTAALQLGLFDPKDNNPYNKVGLESVNNYHNQQLNTLAAQQSLVLVQNSGGTHRRVVPLKAGSRIAVIGPLANDSSTMMGTHWKGYACPVCQHQQAAAAHRRARPP